MRVGFVSVVRPTFKGDSATAARGSLAGLERLGQELGFEVVVPHLPPAGPVAAGRTLPTFSVHDGPAALRAAEQLAAADLDFLLIQHTTFATGELLTPLLRACSRVGVWDRAGPGGTAGMAGKRRRRCGYRPAAPQLVMRPQHDAQLRGGHAPVRRGAGRGR